MLIFLLPIALAQDINDNFNTLHPMFHAEKETHGPDKPPPSDGYTFKGKKGGKAKAKIGFALLLASSIPILSARSLEPGSAEQIQKRNKALIMAGTGLGLILWDRFQD